MGYGRVNCNSLTRQATTPTTMMLAMSAMSMTTMPAMPMHGWHFFKKINNDGGHVSHAHAWLAPFLLLFYFHFFWLFFFLLF